MVLIGFFFVFFNLQTSYRGRKALSLGGVVSPRTQQTNQQQASVSPAPAAVPQPSPTAVQIQQQTQQQTTLNITAQQPQQQQQANLQQQIPTTIAQTMKEQPQQPMVSFSLFLTNISIEVPHCVTVKL